MDLLCDFLKYTYFGEFPGGLVVRIPGFHCHGPGSLPGQGTEIPQAVQRGQNIYIYFLIFKPFS